MIKSSQLSQNSRVIRKRYGLSHKPELTAATEAAARHKSAINAVPGRVGATGALPNFTGKFLSTSYKHNTCKEFCSISFPIVTQNAKSLKKTEMQHITPKWARYCVCYFKVSWIATFFFTLLLHFLYRLLSEATLYCL